MSWNEEVRISCLFRFKCPQTWDRLQLTDREEVRHCPECERDVHLALSEEDFRRHSDEGRSIAVPVLRNEQDDDASEPVYWVGEPAAPYNPWLSRV